MQGASFCLSRVRDTDRERALGQLRYTTDLGEFTDRDLVVEAVAETERVKLDVFATLDKVVRREDAVFTNAKCARGRRDAVGWRRAGRRPNRGPAAGRLVARGDAVVGGDRRDHSPG
ncbi:MULTISPECIES: 3-hydroxyacyl-CoA dehydrogenase NAD-binding domain-containing protein [unclassified Streptomyces]|uniref:3-hydroxyacyl-CoA dehydrogenase NAD-binding domain-containing protein n=1 Tax=unclassified Streptomyces TaxID=2593676 RepID=UPI004042A413